MSQSERQPEQLIRVVDALIEELARLASDETTRPQSFWAQLSDTVQTVVNPKQFGIMSFGTGSDAIVLAGKYEANFPARDIAKRLHEHPEFQVDAPADLADANLVGFRIRQDKTAWGALVVELPPDRKLQANYSILTAIAEIISEFVQNQSQTIQAMRSDWFQKFFEFSVSCHSSLLLNESASVICNDARVMFQSERAQLYYVANHRVTLGAVSSVASVEKRSALMRLSKALAQHVARHGQAVLSNQPDLPDNLRSYVTEYLDMSGMGFIALLPLHSPVQDMGQKQVKQNQTTGSARRQRNRINSIMMVEYPSVPEQLDFLRAAKVVLPHAGLSVANARTHTTIPFRRSLQFAQRLFRFQSFNKLLIGLILLLVAGLLLVTIQVPHKIRITGELRPELERVVFSPRDAFVEKVLVKEGDLVSEGDLLAILYSPELTQQLEKVNGELDKLTEHKSSETGFA